MQDIRWGKSYLSAEMQLVYSTVSADWAGWHWVRRDGM